jgi:hypothetical protein
MSNSKKESSYFVVNYREPKGGEILTIKARKIADSSLGLGFITLSDFVFDSSALVIKPSEEDLKKRLTDVKSLHLNIYAIVSIEERGDKKLTFKKDRSNLIALPTSPAP